VIADLAIFLAPGASASKRLRCNGSQPQPHNTIGKFV
jgi:hypothetical protein